MVELLVPDLNNEDSSLPLGFHFGNNNLLDRPTQFFRGVAEYIEIPVSRANLLIQAANALPEMSGLPGTGLSASAIDGVSSAGDP